MSASERPDMLTTFSRLFSPETSSTWLFLIFSESAMNLIIAEFAAPSTGGAVILTHSVSSRQPVISFLEPRGVTWSFKRVFNGHISLRRLILSSMGGCVLKFRTLPTFRNGFDIKRCAVALLALRITAVLFSIFSNALARPSG